MDLNNLFDTLMKDTQKTRNNKVSRVLTQRDNKSNNSSGLKLRQEESKVMETGNSEGYTWDFFGDSDNIRK